LLRSGTFYFALTAQKEPQKEFAGKPTGQPGREITASSALQGEFKRKCNFGTVGPPK
jgi:hypothetical protein